MIEQYSTDTTEAGGSLTFTISPDTGYQISAVYVDGMTISPIETYTFTNITADHRLAATFVAEAPSGGQSSGLMFNSATPPPSLTPSATLPQTPVHKSTYIPAKVSIKVAPSLVESSRLSKRIELLSQKSTTDIDLSFDTTSPSLSDYVLINTKEKARTIPSFFQKALDRVVNGAQSTVKIPLGQ